MHRDVRLIALAVSALASSLVLLALGCRPNNANQSTLVDWKLREFNDFKVIVPTNLVRDVDMEKQTVEAGPRGFIRGAEVYRGGERENLRIEVSSVTYGKPLVPDLDRGLEEVLSLIAKSLDDPSPNRSISSTVVSGLPAKAADYHLSRGNRHMYIHFIVTGSKGKLWSLRVSYTDRKLEPAARKVLRTFQVKAPSV
ncbi:MAG: hypothetical protein JNK85_05515 [Verrucomicrobiales bacterium]|nr:hypothetical protein [Verrucomicrobiales bacterium]